MRRGSDDQRGARRHRAPWICAAVALLACGPDPGPEEPADPTPASSAAPSPTATPAPLPSTPTLSDPEADRLMDRYLETFARLTEILSQVQQPVDEPAGAAELQAALAELSELRDQLGVTSEEFKMRHLERYAATVLDYYRERKRIQDDPQLGAELVPLFYDIPTLE